jgi:RNA polymerase-binding transcription factor DksA
VDERFMEHAAALEQLHRENAIANASAAPREPLAPFDGLHCIEDDCGDEIPAGRLALGKRRCITCQTLKEKRRVS